MSVPRILLGLLEGGPTHGYTLKQEYDARFGRARPLKFGQVYATLQRLERDGLATAVRVEPGEGPDRKLYAITPEGVSELEEWLQSPEPATSYAQSVLFAKVTLALMSGRSAAEVLDAQRTVHLQRMRELTAARRTGDLVGRLTADYEIAHLDADLRWIEDAGARLDAWRAEVLPEATA